MAGTQTGSDPVIRGLALAIMLAAGPAVSQDFSTSYVEHGKHYTAQDVPTFDIAPDGTVDWFTGSGYRHYHMVCHACHGPDGAGSAYGPDLTETMLKMDYFDFVDLVTNGSRREVGGEIITAPAFGTNPQVMCFVDDIFIYLRARAAGALGSGAPAALAPQPEAAHDAAAFCLGN